MIQHKHDSLWSIRNTTGEEWLELFRVHIIRVRVRVTLFTTQHVQEQHKQNNKLSVCCTAWLSLY